MLHRGELVVHRQLSLVCFLRPSVATHERSVLRWYVHASNWAKVTASVSRLVAATPPHECSMLRRALLRLQRLFSLVRT